MEENPAKIIKPRFNEDQIKITRFTTLCNNIEQFINTALKIEMGNVL
jgi:hypothetical protein